VIEFKKDSDLVDYNSAKEFMLDRVSGIISGERAELLWFLEHPDIYTAGTSAKEQDLIIPDKFPVYNAGRGGEYTYHGPGQRVVYTLLDLNRLYDGKPDLRDYVSKLEKWIINTIKHFDIDGETRADRVGIWVKDKNGNEEKIAAIGIRVRKWVSFHGIALNVNPNLDNFSGIVPCGLSNFGVTSLEKLGVGADLKEVDALLEKEFNKIF